MEYVMKSTKILLSISILFFSLLLNGCGGGGGDAGGGGGDSGAIDNPIVLNYPSSFAHSNNIALTEFGKYFKITGLTPGQDFKLTLTSSDAVRLNVYDLVDYTSRSCQSSSYCLVAGNAQGEAYVKLNGILSAVQPRLITTV